MFLFNSFCGIAFSSNKIFKYIICSYSTKNDFWMSRLSFGFKYIICSYSTNCVGLIFHCSAAFKYIICSYSTIMNIRPTQLHLNTSYVPIQLSNEKVLLNFIIFKYIICSYSTTVFIAFLLSIIPQKLNIFNTFLQNYQSQYTYLYPLPHARLFQHFLLFRPPPPGKVKNISIPKTHYIYRSIPLPFSHSTSASAPLITVILGPRCPKSQSSITGTPKSPSAYNTASS